MPNGRLLHKIAYFFVPSIGVLITLAAGYWASDYHNYGFPLPWKSLVATGICPPEPWLQISCYLRLATLYNWANFLLDALFYTVIGYGLLLPPANFRRLLLQESRKSWAMFRGSLGQVEAKWTRLAMPFQVSALMGIVGGLYATLTLPWLVIVSSFFSGVQPPNSGSFNIVSVAALAFFIAVPVISIGGAVALLTLQMNDDERGILSLFVTVFSFIPMVYLGLEIFAWILQEWPFVIITVFWSVLLFMLARTLRSRSHGRSRFSFDS